MKNIIIISFLMLFSFESHAQAPWDIAYHASPPSFAVNLREDITQIAANLQSTTAQAKSIIMTAKNDATNLQSAVTSTFNNISSGAILSVSGNPGQGKTTFCGKDLKDVKTKKIAQKFKKILFTRKSFLTKDKLDFEERRKKFYMDNVYAIYAASLILQQKLENDIKTKVATIKGCVENNDWGPCDKPNSNGENDTIFAYAKTLEALDSLVSLWESIAALKARLTAITIMRRIDPEVEVGSSEDSSEKTAYVFPEASAVFHSSHPLAFAQVSYKQAATSLSNLEAKVLGSKTEATNLIEQTIDLSAPNPSENVHAFSQLEEEFDAIDELTEVENLVSSAISAHNMLQSLKSYKEAAEQYAEHVKNYQKDLTRLQESEQCAIKYLGKYFTNPVKAWSGIALGKNVFNHNLRKGISGWAYEAYETAKSAETSTITTDDISQHSMEIADVNEYADDPDNSKASKAVSALDVNVDVSKQEKSAEEGKKSNIQSWQIGAEAAKMLGADAASWGTPTSSKMVWTDTKNFYRQYLQRKYANIKSYLKVYTRNDVLALVVAKLKGEKQDINNTKYQKKLQTTTAAAAQKLSDNLQTTISSIKSSNASTNSAIASLQKQREALVAKMDKLSVEIRGNQNAIADERSVADTKSFDKIDEAMNAKVVFPSSGDGSSRVITIPEGNDIDEMYSKNIASNIDSKKIKKLEKENDSIQSKLANYQKQLDKIDTQIASAKLDAQEASSSALNQKAEVVAQIAQTLDDGIKLDAEQYASDVKSNMMSILGASAAINPLLNPVTLYAMAEKAADESLNILYKQVDAIIDGGYQQMLSLGDALYSQDSHQQIVDIHNQMINSVKGLMLTYSVAGIIKIDNLAIYAKLATIDTSVETEGFFVGATAKSRDMKAPFAILNFDMPPVREVFRFDSDDYANIKPQVDGKEVGRALRADDFLNFGGDIPLIWQYILKDNAFVESDYNLKEPLNSGCEDVAFSRGGIFPCVVSGSTKVLDVNSKGEYIERNDIVASSLPKCLLITMENGRPHHTFWDVDVSITKPSIILSKLQQPEKPADKNCTYSELGMLLDADENNNLSFKERAFNAYQALAADTQGKKMNAKQKNQLASAYHAMLIRNQIGDFLKQAEAEKLSRENLAEYKQKFDEQMAGLKESLRSYGYEPAENFDLTKASDYSAAERAMKSIKNKKVSAASSAVSGIKFGDGNAVAQEKSTNMKKLIAILNKDANANLKLSTLSYDNNNIDADLKKAKADGAVVDKYKNSLKEQAKEYNNVDEAFCANY